MRDTRLVTAFSGVARNFSQGVRNSVKYESIPNRRSSLFPDCCNYTVVSIAA